MAENNAWQLEDFVDSLVVELDKTRETLAVKAINKPLSYSVKEVALDVNAFPTFDGDSVRFLTAQPGQEGAVEADHPARLHHRPAGAGHDQASRATAGRERVGDLDVDEKTRSRLRKIGVSSVDDLKDLQARKVDLKAATGSDIDYSSLARKINQSRGPVAAPRIDGVSLSLSDGEPCLLGRGQHPRCRPDLPAGGGDQRPPGRGARPSGPGHVTLRLDPSIRWARRTSSW